MNVHDICTFGIIPSKVIASEKNLPPFGAKEEDLPPDEHQLDI